MMSIVLAIISSCTFTDEKSVDEFGSRLLIAMFSGTAETV